MITRSWARQGSPDPGGGAPSRNQYAWWSTAAAAAVVAFLAAVSAIRWSAITAAPLTGTAFVAAVQGVCRARGKSTTAPMASLSTLVVAAAMLSVVAVLATRR